MKPVINSTVALFSATPIRQESQPQFYLSHRNVSSWRYGSSPARSYFIPARCHVDIDTLLWDMKEEHSDLIRLNWKQRTHILYHALFYTKLNLKGIKSSVDVRGEYFRVKHRVLDSAIDMLRNTVKNVCLQEEKASFCSAGKKKKKAWEEASPLGRVGE